MAKIVEFFVPGKRIATAGSKVSGVTQDGRRFYRHASKFTKPWMDSVKFFAIKAYQRGIIHPGPLGLIIWFYMTRPKHHYGTGRNEGVLKEWALQMQPTGKPDLSKCVRALEDALTGIIWKDDSQVVYIQTGKLYGDKTGAHVEIMDAPDIKEIIAEKE